ncbi:hypothetical protein E2C01_092118 [Portunus trituberculatus]|uniref:Uncharacterized protein n=1 Tax=Portunus trituberculatus TaxID=210409 RepID=A0A5B7JPR9_PORTR|nr:hypothetical protein [Portunus trituberculatus]
MSTCVHGFGLSLLAQPTQTKLRSEREEKNPQLVYLSRRQGVGGGGAGRL